MGEKPKSEITRVALRLRESQVTLAAWRLQTAAGAIVLIEPSPALQRYRGEGGFLGWSQEKLAAVWVEHSARPSGEPDFELPRLG